MLALWYEVWVLDVFGVTLPGGPIPRLKLSSLGSFNHGLLECPVSLESTVLKAAVARLRPPRGDQPLAKPQRDL